LLWSGDKGDGTFADATRAAGDKPKKIWSISAGWFDYDNDGLLDLFVVNYCKWDPQTEVYCGLPKPGYRTYCHPKRYEGLPNSLYRNNGDGTFTDLSVESGIAAHIGKGMGVAFADYNDDGWTDIFVANDTVPQNRPSPAQSRNDFSWLRVLQHEACAFRPGSVSHVREITVRWPSGASQTLNEVAADQRLRIEEP
jgi:hypothetical protein